MIFDKSGLPRDNGASDFNDSARLAGLLAVFEWPCSIDFGYYVKHNPTRYVRHPKEYKYDFSRDQAICLMAGISKICDPFWEFKRFSINKNYIDGKDWFSPSQNGHVRICRGLKSHWYQNLWLWLDVLWSCYVQPLAEPNQLLCMMIVHPDKKYLKFWLKHNKKWKESINLYWRDSFRNEPELAKHMIEFLEVSK